MCGGRGHHVEFNRSIDVILVQLQEIEMRLHLALFRYVSEARGAVAGKRRPLRWRVLGGTAVLCAALAGYHYWKADPTQRRRLRVGAEGVVRFLR